MTKRAVPPTLTRRLLLARLSTALPQFPRELLRAGLEEVIAALSQAIISGRPLTLRGFGRWELRRYYKTSRKKSGVIFRPSPVLLKRLN